MSLVSDITLIRTDTTLDLSQKAEKSMPLLCYPSLLCISPKPLPIADRMGHCIVLLSLASECSTPFFLRSRIPALAYFPYFGSGCLSTFLSPVAGEIVGHNQSTS